jgi:hypothetical protein
MATPRSSPLDGGGQAEGAMIIPATCTNSQTVANRRQIKDQVGWAFSSGTVLSTDSTGRRMWIGSIDEKTLVSVVPDHEGIMS